jgi:hypothetical protein
MYGVADAEGDLHGLANVGDPRLQANACANLLEPEPESCGVSAMN